MSRSSQKPKVDNRSTIIKGFVKPEVLNFHNNNKSQPTFKPGPRFQSINRGRR
ncbi:MAG: hypothetical protein WC895_01305 [Candidatus Shapirobacteria bacterium]